MQVCNFDLLNKLKLDTVIAIKGVLKKKWFRYKVKKSYMCMHWYKVYSSSSFDIADGLLEMETRLSNVNVHGPDKLAIKGNWVMLRVLRKGFLYGNSLTYIWNSPFVTFMGQYDWKLEFPDLVSKKFSYGIEVSVQRFKAGNRPKTGEQTWPSHTALFYFIQNCR
jgi:hypothetical protein